MRVITAGEEAKLVNPLWRVRVLVADATGILRDLTTLGGGLFDAVKSVRWGEDVDAPGLTADFELFRNLDAISLSPLHDTSPLNRATPFDAASALGALIDLNRKVRIEWALTSGEGETPVWVPAFEGLIESFSLDGEESMQVGCRGQYAELQDRVYEEELVFAFAATLAAGAFRVWQPNTAYSVGQYVIPTTARSTNARWYTVTTAGTSGATEPTWPTSGTVSSGSAVFTHSGSTSSTAGYAVENVLTQMALAVIPSGSARFGEFDDLTRINVFAPTSPGWNINVFQVKRESVWNAMQALAQQIGWDLRWKWDSGESGWRLHLYDPQRAKTTPDRTLAVEDVSAYEDVALDIANIRNVVRVVYSDASDVDPGGTPRRKTVTVVDAASEARFGRRYMEVAEGSSSAIDSPGEAADFAGRMLSDLASPVAEVGVTLRFFPYVELTDLLRLPPDGRRFTSAQNLAVTSYQHSWSEGVGETKVRVRGKPSSGWYRWARIATPANPQDLHRLVDRSNVGEFLTGTDAQFRGVAVRPVTRASNAGLQQQWQVHVSDTPGFTPGATTARGTSTQPYLAGLRPGASLTARLIPVTWNDQRQVLGQPSEDIPFTVPYVEPFDLNPETHSRAGLLNGGFEASFDAYNTEPAHWALVAGAWKVDVGRASTDSAEGLTSVEWASTSGTFGLRSAFFPVAPGEAYAVSHALKRVSGDGNVRLTVEWYTRGKVLSTSVTVDTATSAYGAWGRSVETVVEAPGDAAFARITIARAAVGTWSFRVDDVVLRPAGQAVQGVAALALYGANWADFGAGFRNAAFWRDASGTVRLTGRMQTLIARAANSVPFTLPVGFRPAGQLTFPVFAQGAIAQLQVTAAGAVTLTPALALNDWVSLDGVAFTTR